MKNIIDFGTYTGIEIEKVPASYLREQAPKWVNEANRKAALDELLRRERTGDSVPEPE